MNVLRSLTLATLSTGIALVAMATEQNASAGHSAQHSSPSSPLIDKVRQATRRYRDVNVAIGEMWVPATPCVSGPEEGAMGVHYVLPPRLGDGLLNVEEPEALIYEPTANGGLRLVGVEYIVFAKDWTDAHPTGPATPSLEGHLTNYVGAPNRYGLDPFFEIHVWAWERNPKGHFADWNTQVTCEKQPLE